MDKPWKMLVYITADNTLYIDALVSLRQLTEASLLNNVDIIVQLDGPSFNQGSRYKCVRGQTDLLSKAPDNYSDLQPSKRLMNFLNAEEAQPSTGQQVCLILWGHGAGLDTYFQYSNPPASPGENLANNANMYVTNIKLGTALSEYSKANQRKIDILGLDSCLMGMTEICYEVSSGVSVMVASDEDVPDHSWPYDTILGDLNKFPGMDARTLSTVIINRYLERYTQKGNKTRVSLSSMNLSVSEQLKEEMKGLVGALNKALDNDKDGTVRNAIFSARDASRTPDEGVYIDYAAFCEELLQSFSQEHIEKPNNQYTNVCVQAKKVLDVLLKSSYILYHRDAREDSSIDPYGLAIYFPPTQDRITSQLNNELTAKVLPREDVKFPGTRTKFPGTRTKSADVPQITGYEILWDHYVQLQFNQETGWAKVVARLVGYPNTVQAAKKTASPADGQTAGPTALPGKKEPNGDPASPPAPC